MYDDIKKAIEKNLSAEVGDRLKEQLDKLERLEKKVEELRGENTRLIEKNQKLEKELNEYQEIEATLDEAQTMLQGAKVKEEILKLHENHANEKVDLIKGLVETVFKSPDMRSQFAFNATLPVRENGMTYSENAYGNVDKVDKGQGE